jgi:hypothetical protein
LRLASECDVEKHRREKVTELPALREDQGVVSVVMIKASEHLVYVRPYVDTALVTEERLSGWRTARMSVAAWVAAFSLHEGDLETQQPSEDFSPEEIGELTSRVRASSRMLATPKRARFAKPEDWIPVKSEFSRLPAPSPSNLGPSRDLLIALREHQSQLEAVFGTLQVAQGESQREAAHLGRSQTAVADKVNVLQGSVGTAVSNLLAPTLWQSAEELSDRLAVQEAEPWAAQLDAVTASVSSVRKEVADATKGVEAIYKGAAGDTLKAANHFLAKEHPVWKARLAQPTSPNPPAGASAASLPPEIQDTLKRLESKVKLLQDQSEASSVTIKGVTFPTLPSTVAWVKAQGVTENVLLFVDWIALMQIPLAGQETASELVKAVHDGAKVGVDDPTQVQVFHSLGLEGPTYLVGKKSEAIKSPHLLGPMKTYESFYGSGQMIDGYKVMIENGVESALGPLQEAIRMSGLSSEAEDVAIKMANLSEDFIRGLFRFMVHEYERQGASSTLTTEKRWLLIQRLVRIVCHEFHKVRSGPALLSVSRVRKDPEMAGRVLWAVLQSHRLMLEFKKMDFRLHTSIAPVLTMHLLTICAFRDDLDSFKKTMEKELAAARLTAKEAKQVADRALTNSGTKKKRQDGDVP